MFFIQVLIIFLIVLACLVKSFFKLLAADKYFIQKNRNLDQFNESQAKFLALKSCNSEPLRL